MFKHVMVPVDITQLESLSRALQAAADLAKTHGAGLTYVGVHESVPTEAASDSADYAAKLKAFAEQQAAAHGITTAFLPVLSHDPGAELGSALLSTISDIGADVIVMASHVPGWVEHVFHSNAGYIACHAPVSVFVVR